MILEMFEFIMFTVFTLFGILIDALALRLWMHRYIKYFSLFVSQIIQLLDELCDSVLV